MESKVKKEGQGGVVLRGRFCKERGVHFREGGVKLRSGGAMKRKDSSITGEWGLKSLEGGTDKM